MKDGVVSGVLDWSGFRIIDPAHDVAATKVIMSTVAPVLVPLLVRSLLPDYSGPHPILTPNYVERYLAVYHKNRPLIQEQLTYFEVHRLILGLVDGAGGFEVWRHPDILTQIQHAIREYTVLISIFPC